MSSDPSMTDTTTPVVGECDCVYCAEIGAPKLCRGYRLVSASAVGEEGSASARLAKAMWGIDLVSPTPSPAISDREEIVGVLRALADAYECLCGQSGMNYHESPSSHYARARSLLAKLGGTS